MTGDSVRSGPFIARGPAQLFDSLAPLRLSIGETGETGSCLSEVTTSSSEVGTSFREVPSWLRELTTSLNELGTLFNELGTLFTEVTASFREVPTSARELGTWLREVPSSFREVTTLFTEVPSWLAEAGAWRGFCLVPAGQQTNIMAIYHVSLGFATLPDVELDAFVENVIASMATNPNYILPAPTIAVLTSASNTFKNALAATVQGGTMATAAKDAARATLVALLRQEANYVQGIANNNLAVLLSSGFESVTTSNAQTPLDKPAILKIINGVSGQLKLRGTAIANAKSYEMRKMTVPGVWDAATVIFTKARTMIWVGLTPGTMYTFSFRAIGGSTGASDWSDPVSHMAT